MSRIIYTFWFLSFSLAADDGNGVDDAQNFSVQLSHAERLLNGFSLIGNEYELTDNYLIEIGLSPKIIDLIKWRVCMRLQ